MRLQPKPNVFFLFLFLFFGKCSFSQTTFDSVGRLASIRITADSIEPAVGPLRDSGSHIKEQIRWMLQQKTQEAIRVIRSNNYKRSLHKLYMQIWRNDSASLLNYLGQVNSALMSDNRANINSPFGVAFNTIFNKHLSDTAMVFRWVPINNQEGVLVKKDVLRSFLTDYYNITLPDIIGSNVNKEDIVEAVYYLVEQSGKITSAMNVYRSGMNNFRKPFYDSLRNFHNQFVLATSTYTTSLNLLRNTWFKKWFWLTGGIVRINPIDYGVDTIIQKNGASLSLVNYNGHRSDDFYLEKRQDSLDYYFMESKPNVAITEKWVNKVSVPENGPYFQYSAMGRIKFSNDEKELKRNLHTDETKTVVIHNIPADRKAGLREDRKPIPNKSSFEEGLDDVISKLGELAKVYGQISAAPWSAAAEFLVPKPTYNNPTITSNRIAAPLGFVGGGVDRISITVNAYDRFTVSGEAGDNFLSAFRTLLNGRGVGIAPIFDSVFGTRPISFGEANGNTYKSQLRDNFKNYLQMIMQHAANQVLEDSFMVAGLLNIYNTASSPLLQPIKTRQDNRFYYYSSTLKTTALDSTVETTVSPYTTVAKTNTDSIFIGKFTYKIGRTRRMTLSAGLAYTLNSYDQSVAKAENGTISITNSNQLFRFVAGLNVYFGKGLYSFDNGLGKFKDRWFGFIGVGIPKAIENIYIGGGRDLVPGLKLTAGLHVAKHNKYLIQNNQIVEERLRYNVAGPFVSVMIDPSSLVNLLNVFKKVQ